MSFYDWSQYWNVWLLFLMSFVRVACFCVDDIPVRLVIEQLFVKISENWCLFPWLRVMRATVCWDGFVSALLVDWWEYKNAKLLQIGVNLLQNFYFSLVWMEICEIMFAWICVLRMCCAYVCLCLFWWMKDIWLGI